ncbi:MAG: FAD-binding protein, partial [Ignavibacteria bacterium]|nr:FAD-binding protein [Ignavibacteria bacterium]
MPPNPRDARVVPNHQNQWTNKHENFTQSIELYYDIWNPPPPVSDGFADLGLTVAKLQSLIGQAAQDNIRLRAYGGTWSLSHAAVTNGRLINTKPLNWWFPLKSNFVSADYQGSQPGLVFAQCGISVGELNDHLLKRKSALKTSGASNGQTIVGAVSTGTHGSAIEVGAMQDFVVGMHIIVGPDRHIWLERSLYPVVSNEFLNRLGAELVRDDTLFDAAVVSFGSFGIIHAMLLETEPIYLLEASRLRMPIDNQLRQAMNTLDFTHLALHHQNEKPFHFEVVINPHDVDNGAYVTTMYKRPYRDDYTRPSPSQGGLAPGDDVLGVIGRVGDAVPASIPALVNTFVGQTYEEYQMKQGTLGEIFSWNTVHG